MMMKTLLKSLCLLLGLGLGGAASAAESLTASVDRNAISANETLTLKVRFDGGQAQSSPDFSSLLGQFDILSNQQSSQHSIINGKVNVATEWTLMLAPKMNGEILIPPFQVQGQRSEPITVKVTAASVSSTGGRDDVFVTLETDKQQVFINEQLMVTFTLYYNQTVESLDKPEFTLPDTRITELERVDYQTTLDQTRYGVAKYRYLVFPDATGSIAIEPQTWTVRTTDQPNVGRFGFGGGRIKLYRPKTEALTIPVLAKPAQYPANAVWLPASNVELGERWSRDPSTLQMGEPVTWTITINAEGVTSEQLPPLLTGLQPDGFKIYPDQPSHETQTGAEGISSVRTESVAIVPNQAGEMALPAVELSWWDTTSGEVKTATLPARTIQVLGAARLGAGSAAAAADSPAPPGVEAPAGATAEAPTSWLVQALLGLLLVSNLVFAWLWWRNRHRPAATAAADRQSTLDHKPYKALLRACDVGSALEIRRALLAWARVRFPQARPIGMAELARRLDDPELASSLETIDNSLYAPGDAAEIDRTRLKQAVARLNAEGAGNAAGGELKPLYAA